MFTESLNDFILAYRTTPHSVTGRTSAELFLKKQPRVNLSLQKTKLCAGNEVTKSAALQLAMRAGEVTLRCTFAIQDLSSTQGASSWRGKKQSWYNK